MYTAYATMHGPRLVLEIPYRAPAFFQALHGVIDRSAYRSEHSGRRLIFTDESVYPYVISLADQFFAVFSNTTGVEGAEISVKEPKPTNEWAVLYLTKDAPIEVVKAAYRALMVLHHPDKGGDEETAQKINEAYHSIMKAIQ